MCMYKSMCTCMWSPEDNFGYNSSSTITFVFKTVSPGLGFDDWTKLAS